MTDLIRALIQVKTPLTLFAFVCLVFLAAFRTKQAPELFFRLMTKVVGTLPKDRLAVLLHRFMLYTFAAFVLACAITVAGQILAAKTQPGPVSLTDFSSELKTTSAPDDQKQAALKDYTDGLAFVREREFAQAIQALQHSVDSIPTLSAQITLAYLYRDQGDQPNAKKYATAAQSLASLRGDSLAQVRLEPLLSGGDRLPLVGDKKPLPEGGKSCEESLAISPGLYITTHDLATGVLQYFKVRLKSGQTLRIDMRTPDLEYVAAGASIYDADCVLQDPPGAVFAGSPAKLATAQWTTTVEQTVHFSVGIRGLFPNHAQSVYRISVQ